MRIKNVLPRINLETIMLYFPTLKFEGNSVIVSRGDTWLSLLPEKNSQCLCYIPIMFWAEKNLKNGSNQVNRHVAQAVITKKYMVFDIRYTICSPPQMTFKWCSEEGTESRLWRREQIVRRWHVHIQNNHNWSRCSYFAIWPWHIRLVVKQQLSPIKPI